jgi:pyruvate formate lyase activating enzyme
MSEMSARIGESDLAAPSTVPGRYWDRLDDGRLQCNVCPRFCRLYEGQRGLCFVRAAGPDGIVLTSCGRSSGFCVDPIEKKPLNHFLPGSAVLSFGAASCNLTCKFCQNWDMSKSRQMDTLADAASPETLVRAALGLGCRSVAFTYNDPVIFLEYAMDVAIACREAGVKRVAVSAGYVTAPARQEFFSEIDAVNIDLKAFSESFYRNICGGQLESVFETLIYLVHETSVWTEITTLLVPGENDSNEELSNMCAWIAEHLGNDVPLHFSAFHPDWKMPDHPNTPHATLLRARAIAQQHGLHHVYVGNVHDTAGASTYCAGCGTRLIERDWYQLVGWTLDDAGQCRKYGEKMAGVVDGPPGTWGRRRLPVRLRDFEPGGRRHNQSISSATRSPRAPLQR